MSRTPRQVPVLAGVLAEYHMSRHELYAHPRPVLTCPQCIAILTTDIVYRKVNRR